MSIVYLFLQVVIMVGVDLDILVGLLVLVEVR
jgi:hypothetical protein